MASALCTLFMYVPAYMTQVLSMSRWRLRCQSHLIEE